ncbi:hypothetical protein [Sagittula sp. S175]|uniref:hypothetical protein n=1 Tax=Sagittula sp. S175 TaxID=3415129 RepID=UPI003C7E5692
MELKVNTGTLHLTAMDEDYDGFFALNRGDFSADPIRLYRWDCSINAGWPDPRRDRWAVNADLVFDMGKSAPPGVMTFSKAHGAENKAAALRALGVADDDALRKALDAAVAPLVAIIPYDKLVDNIAHGRRVDLFVIERYIRWSATITGHGEQAQGWFQVPIAFRLFSSVLGTCSGDPVDLLFEERSVSGRVPLSDKTKALVRGHQDSLASLRKAINEGIRKEHERQKALRQLWLEQERARAEEDGGAQGGGQGGGQTEGD